MHTPEYGFRVTWDCEDGNFVATCPEFPGVSGFGKTRNSALKEAEKSLRLAMETFREEGWELPPLEPLSAFSGQFRLRIPKKLHAELAGEASEEGISLNSYILTLISLGKGKKEVLEAVKKEVKAISRAGIAFAKPGARDYAKNTSIDYVTKSDALNAVSGGSRWQN
jgi:predicted HicB family RNase H-like nuclease